MTTKSFRVYIGFKQYIISVSMFMIKEKKQQLAQTDSVNSDLLLAKFKFLHENNDCSNIAGKSNGCLSDPNTYFFL